jgi:hypothetical protein
LKFLLPRNVARGGEAVEEAADDGGRHDPGRHRQVREAQRTCRQVGKAQLAHDGECRAILDLENALGRELRLRHLPHAGNEQPDADRPEHEPLATRGMTSAAVPNHSASAITPAAGRTSISRTIDARYIVAPGAIPDRRGT